jgi:hypothetical protein
MTVTCLSALQVGEAISSLMQEHCCCCSCWWKLSCDRLLLCRHGGLLLLLRPEKIKEGREKGPLAVLALTGTGPPTVWDGSEPATGAALSPCMLAAAAAVAAAVSRHGVSITPAAAAAWGDVG